MITWQKQTQTFPRVRSAPTTNTSRFFLWIGYYLLLITATIIGVGYGYYFSEAFFPGDKPQWAETILNALKLFWIIPLPYALLNFFSFVRYPVFKRPKPGRPIVIPGVKLYVRIVTRGHNPQLVAQTARSASEALSAVLPDNAWMVEIVTDNPLLLADFNTEVIVVPNDYQTPNLTKYKGRALHYALSASSASDWVIHLDEETHFDSDTVRHIQQFVREQHQAVARGKQILPKIGQGVILYGKRRVTNWITTLADSLRVGDDYGRFRLQFEHGKAHFGMHGSFIVINNGFEAQIGFDHGPKSSITEDAYFALLAQAAGAEFAFINAFMYEQSPFTIWDFVKQRRRWFGGLWLCVLAPEIPLSQRLVLGTFMGLWSVSWLCLALVYANFLYPTGTPTWIAVCGGLSFLYYVMLYMIGFLRTYDREKLGYRFYPLLVVQVLLIPLFSAMESAGVIYGLISPPKDFYIVKKEG